MSNFNLTEIEKTKDRFGNREKTLPGYWGTDSDGLAIFTKALQQAKHSNDHASVEVYRKHYQELCGYVRIVNTTFDEMKKKPAQAFINFNISCMMLDRYLQENEPIEIAIQLAIRKTHSAITNAKKDKEHWLRKTTTWKRLFAD
jgi:CII-binding regulator of phage lambda lysogenization HflD